ncbi:MAG: hypothetical protein GWN30_31520, partial [Gammaproteobacteria bacterium]|nr:hypothetical protein [Gammaproteobacteria bacterium]
MENKLPENIRKRSFQVYEKLLESPSTSISYTEAGLLAFGLYEHYRELKKWESPIANILSVYIP